MKNKNSDYDAKCLLQTMHFSKHLVNYLFSHSFLKQGLLLIMLQIRPHTSSHPLGLFSFCILFAYSQAWSSVASWCLSSASYLLIFSLVLDPGAEGRWGAGREVPTVQGDISQCPDQWSYMLKEHLFHLHANLAYTGLQERKGGERKLSCLLLLCQR